MDIQSILATHHSKSSDHRIEDDKEIPLPSTSMIPDLFFDNVLVQYKLNRVEIMVMMFLYRQVWCRPNLYRKYGIGPMLSYTEMANALNFTIEEIYQVLRKLESLRFITTVRSGQYFVRKYFTEEFDRKYRQCYDKF